VEVVLDADLRSYFDKIDQERLVGLIAEEISDGRVLRLIRSFLEAGVIVDGAWEPTKTGVPQGGVASPLWSNIYLTPFDHAMTKAGYRLTRWADDFVIVCRTRQEAEAALATARAFLHERLGVSRIRRRPASCTSRTGSSSSATRFVREKGSSCPHTSAQLEPTHWIFTPFQGKNRWIGSRIKSVA
jgi:hypothetical protein